jgi:hypothetical protein
MFSEVFEDLGQQRTYMWNGDPLTNDIWSFEISRKLRNYFEEGNTSLKTNNRSVRELWEDAREKSIC